MQSIEDIQTFGPDGVALENWCETEIKVHSTNYLWVIHDYNYHKANLPKGEVLKSPLIEAAINDKCKWYIGVHPNGCKESKIIYPNDFSVHVYLDGTSTCKAALASFKLSILNENNKIDLCREETAVKKFEPDGTGWGFSEFIYTGDYKLPSDKKLVIYCELNKIYVLSNNHDIASINHHAHSTDSKDSENRLSEDFRQLFKNEKFSDVVVSAIGKDYKAHKSILSSRSPVFAAMFNYEDMKENQQNKIDISDFDAQTVEEMLMYIYTGKSENLNKLADKLLMIAEKYGLDGLKDMSERTLVQNLSAKNAIDMLVFADLHYAYKLRSNVVNFIVGISAQLMGTPAWENLVVSHPHLVVEVCKAISNTYRK